MKIARTTGILRYAFNRAMTFTRTKLFTIPFFKIYHTNKDLGIWPLSVYIDPSPKIFSQNYPFSLQPTNPQSILAAMR